MSMCRLLYSQTWSVWLVMAFVAIRFSVSRNLMCIFQLSTGKHKIEIITTYATNDRTYFHCLSSLYIYIYIYMQLVAVFGVFAVVQQPEHYHQPINISPKIVIAIAKPVIKHAESKLVYRIGRLFTTKCFHHHCIKGQCFYLQSIELAQLHTHTFPNGMNDQAHRCSFPAISIAHQFLQKNSSFNNT